MGSRRRFSREFKQEAVRLVRERGVAMAQVARDLDVHVNLLRGWVRAQMADPAHAFPGEGQQKPEAAELIDIERASGASPQVGLRLRLREPSEANRERREHEQR